MRSRSSKLLDLRFDDGIDEQSYNSKREEILIQINQAENELNKYRNYDVERSSDSLKELIKLLKNPLYAYRVANHEKKGDLIKSMMKNIAVYPDRLTFEWQTPFLEFLDAKNQHFTADSLPGQILREN